jgi:hypothetical protein
MAIADPSGGAPLRGSPAVLVGEGHAPLWQYFGVVWRQTSPLLPPKGTDPRILRLFPCKLAASWGSMKGP